MQFGTVVFQVRLNFVAGISLRFFASGPTNDAMVDACFIFFGTMLVAGSAGLLSHYCSNGRAGALCTHATHLLPRRLSPVFRLPDTGRVLVFQG
jgi:hypothetical protein